MPCNWDNISDPDFDGCGDCAFCCATGDLPPTDPAADLHARLTASLLHAGPLGDRQHALREQIYQLEGLYSILEEARIQAMIEQLQSKEAAMLKRIVTEMIDAASRQPGESLRRPLSRGLTLHMLIENGTTSFGISRRDDDAYPSMVEWRACLNALPYKMRINNPCSAHRERRYWLYAEWPTPVQERMT